MALPRRRQGSTAGGWPYSVKATPTRTPAEGVRDLGGTTILKTQLAQPWMVIGPTSLRPVKEPVYCFYLQVVNAGVPVVHHASRIELPVLIAIGAVPLTGIIVPLIRESHRDAIPVERPEFFDEPILEFFLPFARKQLHNLLTPIDELRPIAPSAVQRIAQRDLLRIAGIPAIFGFAYFLDGAFASKGWN
jgi:hypothetical protein